MVLSGVIIVDENLMSKMWCCFVSNAFSPPVAFMIFSYIPKILQFCLFCSVINLSIKDSCLASSLENSTSLYLQTLSLLSISNLSFRNFKEMNGRVSQSRLSISLHICAILFISCFIV